ncbi:MAG: hypothetical protein JWN41_1774 [Thermoleophilia bacterium]|nr:hypothetical protein [Thermoleophilia bacterium]
METALAFIVIALVIYIIYLQAQPKTDAERAKREAMDERMRETKRRQAEKKNIR